MVRTWNVSERGASFLGSRGAGARDLLAAAADVFRGKSVGAESGSVPQQRGGLGCKPTAGVGATTLASAGTAQREGA